MDPPDRELVCDARNGNVAAFKKLYERYYRLAVGLARCRLRDVHLAEDEGRPSLRSLTDGKPHHIVATYDSFTGRKATYVDGHLRFSHAFPVGTLILNGGPSPAVIGNHQSNEPFTGTIDEVAFYDFAISPDEISAHYERAMRGQPYFAPQSGLLAPERWLAITLVRAGTSQVFDTLTGLAIP